MMQAKKIIVILYLFFASCYAQQQAPVPEWIPGLTNDITRFILTKIIENADSDETCLKALLKLSPVNKQWHKLVQLEKTKGLGSALIKKFGLTPVIAVALGKDVIQEQMEKFHQDFTDRMQSYDLNLDEKVEIQYGNSTWPHQCLGHAIKQNKKEIVEFLCSLKPINVNVKMDSKWGKIPLLAGAILCNQDENDLTIIDHLLNAHANLVNTFTITEDESENNNNNNNNNTNVKRVKKEYDPITLAQKQNKLKIAAKLQERYEQSNRKLKEYFDRLLTPRNP